MSIGVSGLSSTTPAQGNFGALKRFVLDYIQGADDPVLLAVAGREINSAIDYMNTRVWEFMRKYQDIPLSAASKTVAMPTDFHKPDRMHVLDSSDRVKGYIRYKAPKIFVNEQPIDTADGSPCRYTVMDGLVHFDRTVSSEYASSNPTVRLWYKGKIQKLVNDSDNLSDIDLPSEVFSYIGWRARASMALIRGLPNRDAMRTADEFWMRMVANDNDQGTDWEYR